MKINRLTPHTQGVQITPTGCASVTKNTALPVYVDPPLYVHATAIAPQHLLTLVSAQGGCDSAHPPCAECAVLVHATVRGWATVKTEHNRSRHTYLSRTDAIRESFRVLRSEVGPSAPLALMIYGWQEENRDRLIVPLQTHTLRVYASNNGYPMTALAVKQESITLMFQSADDKSALPIWAWHYLAGAALFGGSEAGAQVSRDRPA